MPHTLPQDAACARRGCAAPRRSSRSTLPAMSCRQRPWAAHLGVTPRYVHMLFATEAASFSEFVLAQRLVRAHQMLTDPRCIGRPISAIAFDAGFSDLSHFNRTFRRRFG